MAIDHAPEKATAWDVRFVAKGFSVSRGGRRIVTDVSLTMEPGEVVILRGANGAGKTTLLRAFAGLLKADEGEVYFGAIKNDALLEEPQNAAVFLGAANAHKSALSVDENLNFWAELYGAKNHKTLSARSALALDDYKDRLAGTLSTGLARRLGLCRLLIADRPVWFVDEPTASLDQSATKAFIKCIETHRRNGGIAIIAAHDDLIIDNAKMLSLSYSEGAQ